MPQSLRRSDSFDLARERGILIPTSRSGSCMSGRCSGNRVVLQNMATNESSSRKAAAPLAIIKFLEMCLSMCCTVLHYYSFDDGDLVTGFLATGTFCGFDTILFAIMAGYLMNAHINRRIGIFYSILGGAMFLASGVFIIEAWERAYRTRTRDLAITKGSVAIINGIIFIMDTIFAFSYK
uniref:CSON000194 protein n=1 Tax=Culicoides sonorensis TaxID=179676 RepID=A0A336KV20_CULSO